MDTLSQRKFVASIGDITEPTFVARLGDGKVETLGVWVPQAAIEAAGPSGLLVAPFAGSAVAIPVRAQHPQQAPQHQTQQATQLPEGTTVTRLPGGGKATFRPVPKPAKKR